MEPEDWLSVLMDGGVVPKRKGRLSQIAADQTMSMKNVPNEMIHPDENLPGFRLETIFECEEGMNRWVIVCSSKADPNKNLDKIMSEVKTERMVRREPAEPNWLEENRILRCISADENLSDRSVVLIDRRPSTMELVFKPLRKIFDRRQDFFVVFDSSAVMWDQDKLKNFFSGCKLWPVLINIYPVKIFHMEEPTTYYLHMAALLVREIHVSKPIGDIIIFLAREHEFDRLHLLISGWIDFANELAVFPVYHRGINDPILLAPDPPRDPLAYVRRVYLTTDKAEAMFNFKKIWYVIDCGLETRVAKNRKLETNSVEVAPISQDLAKRRAARAGWAGLGGMCYRLYSEATYRTEMCPKTEPEVMRANFSEALLLRDALGLGLINCLDCPTKKSLLQGAKQLWYLGAFDENLNITPLGKVMAELPVQPVLARILTAASLEFECSEEALTIVAMVLTGNVFEFCEGPQMEEAVYKWSNFFHRDGDHLTRLEIFKVWKMNGSSREWCMNNFILYNAMVRARDIKHQLFSTMMRHGLKICSAGTDHTRIRMAITAGLFFHSAKWDPLRGCYLAESDSRKLHISPVSALCSRQPSCVVFDDVRVSRAGVEYMIGVTAVEHTWLNKLARKWFLKEVPMMRVV